MSDEVVCQQGLRHRTDAERDDTAVAEALWAHGRRLVGTGSPYAVTPGTVRKSR